MLAKPLQFNNLSLSDDFGDVSQRVEDSDSRLMEMLAAQAAHRDGSAPDGDEDAIAADEKLDDAEKRTTLQRALNMAASNGDVERIQRILGGGARKYVDLDLPDEEGTAPLIYASCFVRPPPQIYKPDLTNIGPRTSRSRPPRSRSQRRQARSKPMECAHVGDDQSTQRNRQNSTRCRRLPGRKIIFWPHCV